MTTQLIPVFHGAISNETTLLCNARDLHKFLGIGKVFAAWITARISEYGFIENQDFIIFSESGKNSLGRRRKDYHLTLDTAKELAMVERNDKGRQVRRYFIECEKQLMNQPHSGYSRQNVEPLDNNDIANLRWLIRCVTARFKFQAGWNAAIWHALRQATGTPSPFPFSVEDIPVLTDECRRILTITSQASELICQFEKDVMRKVVRDRNAYEAIACKVQSDFDALQITPRGVQVLRKFEEAALLRLQHRHH
ncbi:antA/AntB antirepressor family protein [Serratia symbiotica]|uniref:AntA/AntB antirepressor domain-containing protein n=1 Tax=Serratia symbiotica TaxID=138074 RepID=A0A068Z428_9GAMM|nr:antA/AntB antirepressor family protein [Serratia symbiotica]QLH62274.1 hypothetical protein SYMBAF_04020 [Serratia symbiotica]CDS55694.1 Putative toxin-antitoxin system, toxin component,Bro family (modular protein) [Serratia symbiotica]